MGFAASVLIPAQDTFSLKDTGEQITEALQKTVNTKISMPREINATVNNVSTQAQLLQEHTGNILGASDTERTNQPIQERAFEYGRYLYCNQVVKDYESRNSQE